MLPLTLGCADILGLEPATLGQGGAGSATAAGGAGQGGSGGGPTGLILYVQGSDPADDANTGLTTDDPKRTIQAALDAAIASAAGDPASRIGEIRVCAGTYAETLVLGENLTALPGLWLRGGYACSTWDLPPDYGAPTFATETLLSPSSSMAAAVYIDAELGSGFLIDGFHIQAGTVPAEPSRAVLIDGGASLVLSNNHIHGGAGLSTLPDTFGSVGVEVIDAAPILLKNRIHGGTGQYDGDSNAGSGGVYIHPSTDAPIAEVRENVIFGGNGLHVNGAAGSGGLGSAGVVILSGQAIIDANRVWGGGGAIDGFDATSIASVGVVTYGSANPDIVHNQVNGPAPPFLLTWSSTGVGSSGVVVFSPALLDGNRIYGGPAHEAPSQTLAVVVDAPNAILVNNMIYGGNEEDPMSPPVLNGPVAALVLLTGSNDAIVAHNALYTGNSLNVAATATAVSLGDVTGLAFDKNLVFGYYGAEFPIALGTTCPIPSTMFTSFRQNIFFGFTQGNVMTGGCGAALEPSGAEDSVSMDSQVASGNSEVAHPSEVNNSCDPTGTDCIDLASCVGSSRAPCIFEGWPGLPDGYELLFAEGWTLKPGLDCTEWSSGFATVAAAPTDFLGEPRTPPTTIGPHEQDDWTVMDSACQ